MNLERTVQECLKMLFPDVFVHPSGAVHASKNGHELQVFPKRVQGVLKGWRYSFSNGEGVCVEFYAPVEDVQGFVHSVQKWSYKL